MRQTELHLSEEARSIVEGIRAKGLHQSREVNRAHILSSLDRGVPEAQIMAVLGMGRTAVWRTRAAYLQGGVELAVFDVARSGRPRQYGTDDEARVTALACSAARRRAAAPAEPRPLARVGLCRGRWPRRPAPRRCYRSGAVAHPRCCPTSPRTRRWRVTDNGRRVLSDTLQTYRRYHTQTA